MAVTSKRRFQSDDQEIPGNEDEVGDDVENAMDDEVFGEDEGIGDMETGDGRAYDRTDCEEDPGRLNPRFTRRWNELFAGNRRPENGVVLDYTVPVNREILEFTPADVSESIEFWQFALVGTVIGARIPLDGMRRFVESLWQLSPQIHMADNGVYVFRFDSVEDQLRVLGGGPWLVKGTFPLALKQWSPGLALDPSALVDYPVWVKLPGLDLQFWSPTVLGKIASLIGKPCYVDKLTASRERLAYARVLVELKSGEKIIDSITLKAPSGQEFVQQVVYESKPLQCYRCLKFGHSVRNCSMGTHTAWVPTGNVLPLNHVNNGFPTRADGAPGVKEVSNGGNIGDNGHSTMGQGSGMSAGALGINSGGNAGGAGRFARELGDSPGGNSGGTGMSNSSGASQVAGQSSRGMGGGSGLRPATGFVFGSVSGGGVQQDNRFALLNQEGKEDNIQEPMEDEELQDWTEVSASRKGKTQTVQGLSKGQRVAVGVSQRMLRSRGRMGPGSYG